MHARFALRTTLFVAVVLGLASASSPFAASAQDYTDARAVVEASYENTGGVQWDAIKTMTQSSTLTITTPQGDMEGSAMMTFLFPGYLHMNMMIDVDDTLPMTITQVMMPDSGYAESPQGSTPLPGGQAPESPNEDLALLADDGPTLSLEKTELNGKPVYKVTAELEEGVSSSYYDVESLLKVAKEVPTPAGTAWIYYDDYKSVQGVMLPHKITQEAFGGMKQVMSVGKIQINPEIDRASLFGSK